MNQQPDKLFRDKLQNYQPSVPAAAWERIAASQNKKKRASLWLKIAASVLFGAGAATWIGLYSVTPDSLRSHGNTLSDVSSTLPDQADKQITNPANSPDEHAKGQAVTDVAVPQTREATVPDAAPEEKPGAFKKRAPAVPDHSSVTQSNPAAANTVGVANDVATRSQTVAAHHPVLTPGSEQPAVLNDAQLPVVMQEVLSDGITSHNAVTLTYSTEDVSAYLNKNLEGDATDEDKKQSTLKKLLQKANDLKTNQDPLAELRQRKNEILALNFMNDKRGQKTRN